MADQQQETQQGGLQPAVDVQQEQQQVALGAAATMQDQPTADLQHQLVEEDNDQQHLSPMQTDQQQHTNSAQQDLQDAQQQLLQQQYDQELMQQGGYEQQQQQVWYQLDARGKIENYDEEDWFVPEAVPFKRRQNVSSTMAASKPHPWKRVRHLVAADNYHELPADTPTYVSLEAPPPLYPPKRYCDITGGKN